MKNGRLSIGSCSPVRKKDPKFSCGSMTSYFKSSNSNIHEDPQQLIKNMKNHLHSD